MNQKQIDRMYDGLKLNDNSLGRVLGGVNMPAREAVKMSPAPRVQALIPKRPVNAHK